MNCAAAAADAAHKVMLRSLSPTLLYDILVLITETLHMIPFWNPWDHGSTLELFSRFFVWMFGLIMYNETTYCSRFIFTLVTAVLYCLIFGMFMCSETTLCNSLIFTLVTSVCHYSMLCVMRLSTVVALYSHWS